MLDGRVFGARTGSGPPVVLALHGWRRTHTDLLGVIGDLPGISIDLPGFGASPPPDGPWGSPDYARAVLPLLDELAGPRVVVGHSFGGRVAVQLAAAAPDRLDALVLTGVPLVRGPVQPPAVGYRLLRAATARGMVPARYLEARRRSAGSEDYRAATGVMRDVFVTTVNESYEDVIDRVRCPVAMVYGENDADAPASRNQAARDRFRQATLRVVPGSGHLLDPALTAAVREAVRDAVRAAVGEP